jgi:DNA-binding CsgD family transcriptional regulator
MWMWAQSSLGGSINDPQLDSAWETHLAVENAITERTGRGDPPSTRTLVFFHSISAATALLRADWDRARLHAGLGAATSNGGDYFGMAAKVALALIGQLMGNTEESHGFGRSEIGAAGNPLPAAAVNGNVSSSVTQLLNLGQILEAILRLDRNGARELLAKRGRSVSAMRLFNYAPIVVWIQSIGNTLWADPPAALAEFDAALKGRDLSGGSPDQWTALLMRIRAELLLNLGAPNRAENLIATLLATDRWVALVPAARLQLAVGNPERAISLADEGIYSLKLSMLDRAHLHAIRAAASLAAGAEADEVDRQIRSAGMFCLEAGTAVPFAMLPQELRASLVDLHHPHADGSYCLLLDVAARGGFDNLRQSFPSKNLLIHLTPREKILLPLLGTKATLQEIAQGQFVSVNTVRKQVVSLRKKLGAKNRAEVLPRAHELGLMQNS